MWRRTPNWGQRGDSREGSWRRVPICSRAHLDGQCDVRIGAEAPAPVTGAVVEAATCGEGRRDEVRARHHPQLYPARTCACLAPRDRLLELRFGKVNQAPEQVAIPKSGDSFAITAIPVQSKKPLRLSQQVSPRCPSQPPRGQELISSKARSCSSPL